MRRLVIKLTVVEEKFHKADAAYLRAADRYDRLMENTGYPPRASWLVGRRRERYDQARATFKRRAPRQYMRWLEQREDFLVRKLSAETGRNW